MELEFLGYAHRRNYERLLDDVGCYDVETKSAVYLIALIATDKPERVKEMFDVREHCVIQDAIDADWHYGTTRKAFRLACHLWNGYTPCNVLETFGTQWDKYFLQAIRIRFGF